MSLLDKILGRETRAQLEARAKDADLNAALWKRQAEFAEQNAIKLRASLDMLSSEGHFRNSDGRLLAKGKLPAHIQERIERPFH